MQRTLAAAALLVLACGSPPTVEEELEASIGNADTCVELNHLVDQVLAAERSDELGGSDALELLEFILICRLQRSPPL